MSSWHKASLKKNTIEKKKGVGRVAHFSQPECKANKDNVVNIMYSEPGLFELNQRELIHE